MTTTDVQRPDDGRHFKRIVLTPEEAQTLHACTRGSSSIPPAVVSAAIGYGICRLTPFRAKAKYVALFGGVVGLISSRIAISRMCMMKVASMPNSNLRERLIEAGYAGFSTSERRYQGCQSSGPKAEVQSSSSDEPSTEILFDDYPSMSSFDTYSSLNDSGDIPITDDTDLTEPVNMQKKGVSYDELRQRNRDEYHNKNRQWHAPKVPERSATRETAQQQIPAATGSASKQQRTKYGDVWD